MVAGIALQVRKGESTRSFKKRFNALSKNQKKQVRSIARRQINARTEVKFTRALAAPANVSNVATITRLIQPSLGTGDNSNRIGDEIYLRSLRFHYNVICTDVTNLIRVMLFQWHSDDVPAVSDILEDTGSATGLVLASVRHDQKPDYTVIYDQTHSLDTTGHVTAIRNLFFTKGFKRKVQFIGGSTTTSISNVWVLAVSDSVVPTDPTISYAFQARYNDS